MTDLFEAFDRAFTRALRGDTPDPTERTTMPTRDQRIAQVARILKEHPGAAGHQIVAKVLGISEAQVAQATATDPADTVAAQADFDARHRALTDKLAADAVAAAAKPLQKASPADLATLAAVQFDSAFNR